MVEYREWKTKKNVQISDPKNFEFPPSGVKVLLKSRPPIAKECSTD
ncbi:hypothetical protein JXB01_00230 [Candidatus Micrarchaeota archaeon]|nr:hypothetical protein [Candidatus Micrarchaeota archaeon]